MARAVYSQRFIQEAGLNGSSSYVVPAGFKAVLRDLDVYNGAGGTASVFLQGALGQAIWVHRWALGDGASPQDWHGRQVLETGESVTIRTDVPMDVTLSGYLLSLP
jgi:hypothetical protein